jgi:hypothetical protein
MLTHLAEPAEPHDVIGRLHAYGQKSSSIWSHIGARDIVCGWKRAITYITR